MLWLVEDDARIQAAAIAAAAGDRSARATCVELAYLRLRGLARRYDGLGVSREDLEQEVALGIMRAIERYDPTRGAPFLAWAHTWVRQALQQAIAEQSRPFRLTRHALWACMKRRPCRSNSGSETAASRPQGDLPTP